MAIRDLLVHLDDTAQSAARLDLAAGLAQRFGAHLVGLHVLQVPLPVFAGAEAGGGAALAELIEDLQKEADAAATRVEANFQARIARDGLAGEWRLVEGMLGPQVGTQGRYADLVVVGQAAPEGPADNVHIEAALFDTGRPVLVVPYAGHAGSIGRRALIAWNSSREAARAVHDALPLLAGAEAVTVVTINPESGPDAHGEVPGADIARHLARHGLPVTVRRVAGSGISAGELLLNEVSDLGADLVVMGAFGHSRLREFVLGGATRTMLQQMTVPVLMAH
jgi:nucleotide-binding universal stress UspA family protein